MADDDCLCRPCGFLLGLPFMLLSGILSLIGIVVWVIATLLICICPCGVCLAAVVSFAICLIKLPIRVIRTILAMCCPCGVCIAGALGGAMLLIKLPIKLAMWFTHKVPC